MAADGKEVIGDAKIAVAQHLSPDDMELTLKIGGGGNSLLEVSGEGRSRECLAIELAVGGEGKGLELQEGRRHHVIGEALCQEAAQLLGAG